MGCSPSRTWAGFEMDDLWFRLGDPGRWPRKAKAMNPYAAPRTSALDAKTPARIEGNSREHCPVCNASIDPWLIGNSIFSRRCPECHSKIWMEYSRVQSTIAMALPIVIVGAWFALIGQSTIVYPIGLCGILLPILNVYLRILFGRPVAKKILQSVDGCSAQTP